MFIRNKVTSETINGKTKYIVSIEFDKIDKAKNWVSFQISKFQEFLRSKRTIDTVDNTIRLLNNFKTESNSSLDNIIQTSRNVVSEKFKNESIQKLNDLKKRYSEVLDNIFRYSNNYGSFYEEGRITNNPGILNSLNENLNRYEKEKLEIEKAINKLERQISSYIVCESVDKCKEVYVNRIAKFNDGTEILLVYGEVPGYICVSPDDELGKLINGKKLHEKVFFPSDSIEREIVDIIKYKKV